MLFHVTILNKENFIMDTCAVTAVWYASRVTSHNTLNIAHDALDFCLERIFNIPLLFIFTTCTCTTTNSN